MMHMRIGENLATGDTMRLCDNRIVPHDHTSRWWNDVTCPVCHEVSWQTRNRVAEAEIGGKLNG